MAALPRWPLFHVPLCAGGPLNNVNSPVERFSENENPGPKLTTNRETLSWTAGEISRRRLMRTGLACQGGAHNLKYGVRKVLVEGSMFEEKAKIERTVEQDEDCVGIEVVANLPALNCLLQQFASFNSPGLDPMGSKGLKYFWLGLSGA